jgi:hypothetical protein
MNDWYIQDTKVSSNTITFTRHEELDSEELSDTGEL